MLIKQPNEVSFNFTLKGLIYGQPGIGKSTLGVSTPKPVLLDCDNGIHRMAPGHRPPFLPVTNYSEVTQVLESEVKEYDTIIFDTAGKLLDYMSQWLISDNPKLGRKDGMLTLQGYGARKYEFINLLKKVTVMGKHLLFIAHEIEERSGDDRIIRPEVGGSSGADLIKELDIVGYMEAVGRKRTISFSPSDKYYAKNSARLPEVINVPDLSDGQENVFMSEIIDKCKAALNDEGDLRAKYDELMAVNSAKIDKVSRIDQANLAIEGLGKVTHIWDSKIKLWEMLKAKAASLNLDYNKKTKQFQFATPAAEEEPTPDEDENTEQEELW